MALTTIGDRLTPSVPIQITLGTLVTEPSSNQTVMIYGHANSGTPASSLYTAYTVSNSGSASAATTELAAIYGSGCELIQMVVAAITANAETGGTTFPTLKVVGLASTDTAFGSANVALTNTLNISADFLVNPYDPYSASGNTTALIAQATTMSGADRGAMGQFGTTVVQASTLYAPTAAASLAFYGTQNIVSCLLPSIGESATYSTPQLAAACAAQIASNLAPFNPLDGSEIGGVPAPVLNSNWITVGASLESEAILNQGWTPLRVNANGTVSFVRTITGRVQNPLSNGGDAYLDIQDWQVLYFWRKTLYTNFTQPIYTNVKASQQEAQTILGDVIRLAKLFEAQNMFQSVSQLAPLFQVARGTSDRSRFDVFTPVNCIPGLHVIAINAQAGVLFDQFSVVA